MSPNRLGDYVVKQRGYFFNIGNIKDDFKIPIKQSQESSQEIKFVTSKVDVKMIEAGAAVKEFSSNLDVEAKLELKFNGEFSFYLHSRPGQTLVLENKDKVGNLLSTKIPAWRYKDCFVISKVYGSGSFILLANRRTKNTITVKGKVGPLVEFLNASVSPQVQIRNLSKMGLSIVGEKSGPVVVELFRVNKKGKIFFV
jgi:bifunctional N-acetylglucosamine-1-phosphate-uridyltransferase/glucosamine-1-phosphate-acetyltransferase GlmU-like protein